MAATQSVRVTLAPEEAAAATPDRQPLVEAREPLLPPPAESRRRERGQQATAQSASSATAQILAVSLSAAPFERWPALPTNSFPPLSTAISEQPAPQAS